MGGFLVDTQKLPPADDHQAWRKRIDQFVDIDSKQPKDHENNNPVFTDMRDSVYTHTDSCPACADYELAIRCRMVGLDISSFPCIHAAYYATPLCDNHYNGWECSDVALVRDENGDWGLPIRDQEDGSAETMLRIHHCPWCGKKL